jgi:hypothetical protein
MLLENWIRHRQYQVELFLNFDRRGSNCAEFLLQANNDSLDTGGYPSLRPSGFPLRLLDIQEMNSVFKIRSLRGQKLPMAHVLRVQSNPIEFFVPQLEDVWSRCEQAFYEKFLFADLVGLRFY